MLQREHQQPAGAQRRDPVRDGPEDDVSDDRVELPVESAGSGEVGLQVADLLAAFPLAGHRVLIRRAGGLDAGDPGAAAGQHPGQVSLAASGVQHRRAGDIAEQPEDVRVQQHPPGGIAVGIEGRQALLRHCGPRRHGLGIRRQPHRLILPATSGHRRHPPTRPRARRGMTGWSRRRAALHNHAQRPAALRLLAVAGIAGRGGRPASWYAGKAGNVGSHVVRTLCQAGVRLRLLLRNPGRPDAGVRDQAELAVGDQRNAEYVAEATRGVEAVFWVHPDDWSLPDPGADAERTGEGLAAAMRQNRIPRVVFLSSIGAEKRHGAGFIDGLARIEQPLDAAREQTGTALLQMRCLPAASGPAAGGQHARHGPASDEKTSSSQLPLSWSKSQPITRPRHDPPAPRRFADLLIDGLSTRPELEQARGVSTSKQMASRSSLTLGSAAPAVSINSLNPREVPRLRRQRAATTAAAYSARNCSWHRAARTRRISTGSSGLVRAAPLEPSTGP
jgi:hypothetical protein